MEVCIDFPNMKFEDERCGTSGDQNGLDVLSVYHVEVDLTIAYEAFCFQLALTWTNKMNRIMN